MRFEAVRATGPLRGSVRVPGDKSISHRAVLFASLAEGTSHLTGVLDSEDVRSTVAAVRALGAEVTERESAVGTAGASGSGSANGPGGPGSALDVTGWGANGPHPPNEPIDCGNSGTTARLLLGALAGWPITATIAGDVSLSKRPMRRVTQPLEQMGASFETTEGHLPVTVRGAHLAGIEYESPVASAQVKTALLLAGLRASGRTLVREPSLSRDHTERLLPAFGVPVGRDIGATCWVDGPVLPRAHDLAVPGDPSSASFLVAAALVVPGSEVTLPEVSLNQTRVGFLRVLERMGATIAATEPGGDARAPYGDEPVGTITASAGGESLRATIVRAEEVPGLIDEIPILALVATQASGTTRFEGVGELRVKESDRLSAIVDGLTALGATCVAGDDWLEVSGPVALRGAVLDSLGDHRLAMTWAVAGLIAHGTVSIEGFECVAVSYPTFSGDLAALNGSRRAV